MLKARFGRYTQPSISHFVPYGILKTGENNLVYKHYVSNETSGATIGNDIIRSNYLLYEIT